MIRPLGKNVLIEPIATAKVSAGGIHMPGGDKGETRQGRVLAAGPGAGDTLTQGDRVLFHARAPAIDVGAEGRILVDVDHILAVL